MATWSAAAHAGAGLPTEAAHPLASAGGKAVRASDQQTSRPKSQSEAEEGDRELILHVSRPYCLIEHRVATRQATCSTPPGTDWLVEPLTLCELIGWASHSAVAERVHEMMLRNPLPVLNCGGAEEETKMEGGRSASCRTAPGNAPPTPLRTPLRRH
jgi:hypothetical protein